MRKAIFWICMIALVPGSIWGYGVICAGLDARNGGPRPAQEHTDAVKRVVYAIARSGYDYYFRNFSKVSNREGSTAEALGDM